VACLLVVYTHAAGFGPIFGVPVAGPWGHAIRIFDTFRMPVFFFVAGLLSTSVLSRSWGQLVRRRVLNLVWVYLAWCVLQAVVLTAFLGEIGLDSWRQAALALVWPQQNLWFLFALALYLVVARAMRPLPAWVQIGAALALAVPAASGLALVSPTNPAVGKTVEYFLAFVAAVHLRPLVDRLGPARPVRAVALAIAFLAAAEIEIRAGVTAVPGVPLITGALAVVAGIELCRVVGEWRSVQPLREVGRRTLPVYCVHFLPAILLPALLGPAIVGSPLLPLWPVLATVACLGVALVVHGLTRRVPGLWSWPFRRARAASARHLAPRIGT
jgi:uncharacterized membrane protein YcfT